MPFSGSNQSSRSYPGAYIKNTMNRWWDFFDPSNPAHKIVIMDDVHPSWSDLPYLKQWADRCCTCTCSMNCT